MSFLPAQQLSTPFEDYPNYFLKCFAQGTTTPLAMATETSGATLLAKAEVSAGGTVPIGFIKTDGDAIFQPYLNAPYDAFLFPTAADADANDTSSAIQIADNINLGNGEVVSSIAALRLKTDTIDGEEIFLTGYYADSDGGGGHYVFDIASATADNGGTVIAPALGSGRWLLADTSKVTILQFGAVTGTTDIAFACQASLDALGYMLAPYSSVGYSLDTTILVDDNESVIIDGPINFTASVSAFNVIGNNVSLETVNGRSIWDLNTASAGTRFCVLKSMSQSLDTISVKHFEVVSALGAVYDENDGSNKVTNLTIQDVISTTPKGRQIRLQDIDSGIRISDVVIDLAGSSAFDESIFLIQGFTDLTATDIRITGGDAASTNQHGVDSPGGANLSLARVVCESVGGVGVRITDQTNLNISDLRATLCHGAGQVIITGATGGSLNNISVSGRKDETSPVALSDGLSIISSAGLSVGGIRSDKNTGAGILLSILTDSLANNLEANNNTLSGLLLNASEDNVLTGVKSRDNANYGYEESGVSNSNLVSSAQLQDNTTNNGIQVGAASTTAIYINSAGNFVAATTGAGAF